METKKIQQSIKKKLVISSKVENIKTHFPLCNNQRFLKVKQVSFEFITWYLHALSLIKKKITYLVIK